MKLFYTPNSPYSRVARVAAILLDIPVAFVEVTVRESANELLKYNPAAKVPSLELADGTVLSDTRIICEFFESIATQRLLAPVADAEQRHWEGITGGYLDGVSVWVREARRPVDDQSASILALEKARCHRCLDYFESKWPADMEMRYSNIILVSALELFDKRFPSSWSKMYPKIHRWYKEFSAKPVLVQTGPYD